jgi:hypothetical protein
MNRGACDVPFQPVRLALDDQAERMLGPVSVPPVRPRAPTIPPPQETPAWSPSRGEERDEWPG